MTDDEKKRISDLLGDLDDIPDVPDSELDQTLNTAWVSLSVQADIYMD